MSSQKTIIILDQGRGRMANQLWNSASIYAYCLEKGYHFLNAAFLDYERLFDFPEEPFLFRLAFLKMFRKHRIFMKLRIYRKYLGLIHAIFKKDMIWSKDAEPFYLPPTPTDNPAHARAIEQLESSPGGTHYFNNWLFRNPVGLRIYHREICAYFSPKKVIQDRAEEVVRQARSLTPHLVGVHIRQGDYRTIEKDFYFSPEAVKPILQEYLTRSGKTAGDTTFIIASDEAVDLTIFDGLHVVHAPGAPLDDLITLSKTDIIIGSNSTYGAFAAYYGGVPFIVFEREVMDWSPTGTKGYNYKNRCTRLHA